MVGTTTALDDALLLALLGVEDFLEDMLLLVPVVEAFLVDMLLLVLDVVIFFDIVVVFVAGFATVDVTVFFAVVAAFLIVVVVELCFVEVALASAAAIASSTMKQLHATVKDFTESPLIELAVCFLLHRYSA